MSKIISIDPNKRKAGKQALSMARQLQRYNPFVRVTYCRPAKRNTP